MSKPRRRAQGRSGFQARLPSGKVVQTTEVFMDYDIGQTQTDRLETIQAYR
jgi:hypothetical protein